MRRRKGAIAPYGTRRTITTLVAQLTSVVGLDEGFDPESPAHPSTRLFAAMRQIIERHGGAVEPTTGHAIVALFGAQLLHEDDALRAVRAAAEIRASLRHVTTIGLSTGEVLARTVTGSASLLAGDVVDLAFRLAQAAEPGQIFLAPTTYGQVQRSVDAEAASPIELRGNVQPVRPFLLRSISTEIGARASRFSSPLVGRERELAQLVGALHQATIGRTCQLFSLLGPAGVGKSRLVQEFLEAVRSDVVIVQGRCPPYGERVAFWPVAESIKQAAGIHDTDTADTVRSKIRQLVRDHPRADSIVDEVSAIIGASEAASTNDATFSAIRNTFESIAQARPLVIVFDDIQWAEPSLLSLIDYLARRLPIRTDPPLVHRPT